LRITQNDSLITGFAKQSTHAHTAVVTKSGSLHAVYLEQDDHEAVPDTNTVHSLQIGLGYEAVITQNGSGNIVDLSQTSLAA